MGKLSDEVRALVTTRCETCNVPTFDVCDKCSTNTLSERIKKLEAVAEADKHRRERQWVNMTPNDDLPRRILVAYLDYSDWTDNTLGMEPTNPVIVEMNQARHERNAIIERALAALAALKEGK